MQHTSDRPSRRFAAGSPRRRGAFTVLELLVVVAVAGVLTGLLLPAVMHAREASRRFQCSSHLHQLGIAIHHHHDVQRRLPPAWRPATDDATFVYGWAVPLVPHIEQNGWDERVDLNRRPAALTTPQQAESLSMPLLLCPSDIAQPSFLLFEGTEDESTSSEGDRAAHTVNSDPTPLMALPTANYVGVYGTHEPDDFGEQKALAVQEFADGAIVNEPVIRLRDLRRGSSRTLLIGERQMATVPSTWLGVDQRGQDAGCRLAGAALSSPNCRQCDECEFTSRHPGGVNFLWADGHVSFMSDSVDQAVYRQQAQRLLH